MIKTVKVTNYLNQSVTMEMGFPEKSGFLIAHIAGLQPPKSTINSTQLAGHDGTKFNSARIGDRNIVFTIILQEYATNTIEDLRLKLYKYFPSKKPVRLEFITENRSVYINGYVESNEVNMFSSRVGTQISIICPDPFFYDLSSGFTPISGITPVFTFPFSNESLDQPLIEISQILIATIINVFYGGDQEIGILSRIHARGAATDITLFNDTSGQQLTINTSFLSTMSPAYLIEGDEILVSSIVGNKYVRFLRAGFYYNILNSLNEDYEWITLAPGDNLLGYAAATNPENLQVTLEHKLIYEGI